MAGYPDFFRRAGRRRPGSSASAQWDARGGEHVDDPSNGNEADASPETGGAALAWRAEPFGVDDLDLQSIELITGEDPHRLAEPTPLPAGDELLEKWISSAAATRAPSTEHIAVYRPWHIYGPEWGVYISEPMLIAFAGALAQLTASTPTAVAPLALRQVLAHEWTHFAFEVAATEIEDVLDRPCYEDYLRPERFGRPSVWTAGPLEELVASYAEVEFAHGRFPRWLYPKPRGYAAAVEELCRRSPAGYRDFAHMKREPEAIVAELAGRIAGRALSTSRWGRTVTPQERNQVPLHWFGVGTALATFGAIPKEFGPPSMPSFRRWLAHIGAIETKGGKGAHVKIRLPNGRRTTFTPTKHLKRIEARSLAHRVGLANERELYAVVAAMRIPEGATSAA